MALTVNGDIISPEAIQYELARLVQFYSQHMPEDQIRSQIEVLKERAKDQAIGAKLLLEHANQLDLPVSQEMIDAKRNEMVAGAGGPEAFAQLLAKQGLSEDDLRANLEQGCRVDALVAKVSEGISDPSEADLRAHFEAHSEEYNQAERASARHILIKADAQNKGDLDMARQRVEKIREDIAGGASFAELAEQHSDCPSGKSEGGDLGWFSPGMMVPEFDNAVFSMKVDELSGVVQTSFGFHVIQRTGAQDAQAADFEDAREKVRDFMRHAARGEAIAAFVNELKEKAEIVDE